MSDIKTDTSNPELLVKEKLDVKELSKVAKVTGSSLPIVADAS